VADVEATGGHLRGDFMTNEFVVVAMSVEEELFSSPSSGCDDVELCLI